MQILTKLKKQSFLPLQIWNFFSGEIGPPIYRVLGERPVFHLHSLQPGKQYQVAVYAENAKGISKPPVILPDVRVEAVAPPGYQGQGA